MASGYSYWVGWQVSTSLVYSFLKLPTSPRWLRLRLDVAELVLPRPRVDDPLFHDLPLSALSACRVAANSAKSRVCARGPPPFSPSLLPVLFSPFLRRTNIW